MNERQAGAIALLAVGVAAMVLVAGEWLHPAVPSAPPLIGPEVAGYACGYLRGLAVAQGTTPDEAPPCRAVGEAARRVYDLHEKEIAAAWRQVEQAERALLETLRANCGT